MKHSTVKQWFVKMKNMDGKSYSSIQLIKSVLKPAFQMAAADDLLLKNPFDFKTPSVITNDSVTRVALTKQQEEIFLEFIKNSSCYSKYYDGIFILFNTGMRISEFVGLTISNIDFENNVIIIDHQLRRTLNMEYIITNTKTKSGIRMIPMTPDVKKCFQNIINNRKKVKIEPIIEGYSGFLFLDVQNKPTVALHWENYFKRICNKYNKIPIPIITPHNCRHTFCINMAKAGMNPKTLQYIMGHSNINITLNTYIGFNDAKAEMSKINAL